MSVYLDIHTGVTGYPVSTLSLHWVENSGLYKYKAMILCEQRFVSYNRYEK